jgi:hypothetical protein
MGLTLSFSDSRMEAVSGMDEAVSNFQNFAAIFYQNIE